MCTVRTIDSVQGREHDEPAGEDVEISRAFVNGVQDACNVCEENR